MSSQSVRSGATPAGRLQEVRLGAVLGYQIAQASVTTCAIYESAVGRAAGLHRLEFTVLMLVHENPGCTASSLAKALNVSAPNMALWLERLIAKGHVEREPGTTDRRVSHLRSTVQGAQLAAQAIEDVLAAEAACTANLSAAERGLLAELLHKVALQRPASR
jgi:DNA-binding MarR family transcriptional regulator